MLCKNKTSPWINWKADDEFIFVSFKIEEKTKETECGSLTKA